MTAPLGSRLPLPPQTAGEGTGVGLEAETPDPPVFGTLDDAIIDLVAAPTNQAVSFVLEPSSTGAPLQRIVLIGAGHAHLQVIRWWRRRPIPNASLTLLSAFDRAAYSGMLPGTLAGLYQPDDFLIPLPALCERSGVALIVDRAIRLDPLAKTIELAHQPTLPFDVASINIGSVPSQEALWQTHRSIVSVKPMATFLDRFQVRQQELVTQWRAAGGVGRLQLVIVGAGAAGVELALCLEERFRKADLPWDVALIDGSAQILAGGSERAAHVARKLLKYRGISVFLRQRVVGCVEDGPTELVLDDGSLQPYDLALWATGASPPAVLKGFQLPQSTRGFLTVRETLQSTADFPVFVVGDAAEMTSPAPKAGVYAVRQAPVLWHNLQAFIAGRPLQPFRPQRGFLSLLACGDGTAICDYHGWSTRGAWAWWLKHWIDTRWVRQFR